MEEDLKQKLLDLAIDHLSLVTKTNAQQQFITTVDGRFLIFLLTSPLESISHSSCCVHSHSQNK